MDTAKQLQDRLVTYIHNNGNKYYMEYIVQAGETTRHQMALDHLHDSTRFGEIMEWKNNNVVEITTTLHTGQVVLIPYAPSDMASFELTTSDGSNIRKKPVITAEHFLYLAPNKTQFLYDKKSLTVDAAGLLWVKVYLVPHYKDKLNVLHSVGWICVKQGNIHYTNPAINKGVATG